MSKDSKKPIHKKNACNINNRILRILRNLRIVRTNKKNNQYIKETHTDSENSEKPKSSKKEKENMNEQQMAYTGFMNSKIPNQKKTKNGQHMALTILKILRIPKEKKRDMYQQQRDSENSMNYKNSQTRKQQKKNKTCKKTNRVLVLLRVYEFENKYIQMVTNGFGEFYESQWHHNKKRHAHITNEF